MTSDNELLPLKEWEQMQVDYALPNSDVDSGNLFYISNRLAVALTAALENAERLRVALENLLKDTQHSKHHCGDEEYCPIIAAREALAAAPGMVKCDACGKPMEDRGAAKQWCGDVCFEGSKG